MNFVHHIWMKTAVPTVLIGVLFAVRVVQLRKGAPHKWVEMIIARAAQFMIMPIGSACFSVFPPCLVVYGADPSDPLAPREFHRRDLSVDCGTPAMSLLRTLACLCLLIWLGGYAGTLFLPRYGLLAAAARQQKLFADVDGKRVPHPESAHLHSVYTAFEVRPRGIAQPTACPRGVHATPFAHHYPCLAVLCSRRSAATTTKS